MRVIRDICEDGIRWFDRGSNKGVLAKVICRLIDKLPTGKLLDIIPMIKED